MLKDEMGCLVSETKDDDCPTSVACNTRRDCDDCRVDYRVARILTVVRECKRKLKFNSSVEERERIVHNAAIDKVLAKLEGK